MLVSYLPVQRSVVIIASYFVFRIFCIFHFSIFELFFVVGRSNIFSDYLLWWVMKTIIIFIRLVSNVMMQSSFSLLSSLIPSLAPSHPLIVPFSISLSLFHPLCIFLPLFISLLLLCLSSYSVSLPASICLSVCRPLSSAPSGGYDNFPGRISCLAIYSESYRTRLRPSHVQG